MILMERDSSGVPEQKKEVWISFHGHCIIALLWALHGCPAVGIAWLPCYGHCMTVLLPEVALHEVNVDTHSNAFSREFKQKGKSMRNCGGCGEISQMVCFCFVFATKSYFKVQPGLELTM